MTAPLAKSAFAGIETVAHLAAGGETPALVSHQAALARFLADKSGSMPGRGRMFATVARLKADLGRLLDVPAADIGLLASASEGLFVAARGYTEGEHHLPASNIWLVPWDAGMPARQFTYGPRADTHPRWSPDGKYLAFLSARNDGKTQVWLLNRKGGEAQKLTDTPQNVEDFDWSLDGSRLVLVLRDAKPEELEEAKTKEKAKEKAKDKKASTHQLEYSLNGNKIVLNLP